MVDASVVKIVNVEKTVNVMMDVVVMAKKQKQRKVVDAARLMINKRP
jgi:hypothetical protein